MKVQIRPCHLWGDSVQECSTEEAEFYGVYQGEPGNLQWVANFADYMTSREFAEEVAASSECPLEDLCEF